MYLDLDNCLRCFSWSEPLSPLLKERAGLSEESNNPVPDRD